MKKTMFLFGLSILTVLVAFSSTPALAVVTDSCTNESITIVSDESNTVVGIGAAVETYDESPYWTTIPGAKWIWKSVTVESPNSEEVITVSKTFTVEGTPATTTLNIAADDYYKVSLNGTVVASNSTDLNFVSPQTYTVTGNVVSGQNNLEIELTNAAFYNPTNPGTGGTSVNNPAGVIYSLTSESLKCPTEPDDNGGSSSSSGSSKKSGQKSTSGFLPNTAGGVLAAATEILSSAFSPKYTEPTVLDQNVDESLAMGVSAFEYASATSTIDNQEDTKSFPQGIWCILIALLIAIILYIIWLFMIDNRKKRKDILSHKKGIRLVDFLFFLISGLLVTLVLFLLGITCPLMWLWILLAIICVGIHFEII